MHVGKSYKISEFFFWSRRSLFVLLPVSVVPVLLYHLFDFKAVALPWSIVLMLGTTVALITGFKNSQTYSRSVEAQQAWSGVLTSSRLWGSLCCDVLPAETARKLIYRHIAWLTALRFSLRSPRPWETLNISANAEYQRRRYPVPERATSLRDQLANYASAEEMEDILRAPSPAGRALQMQSAELKSLLDAGALTIQFYLEMLKVVRELHDQQSRSERIKNFPYPRQFAVVSAIFVGIFCLMLPFGMIDQFAQLDAEIDGFLKGYMVWLVVPFSVLIGWMYMSLDLVGESTANPFEGSANDVPISQISRAIEIELRALLGDKELPERLEPANGIAM